MPSRNRNEHTISRRFFLKQMGWAPVLFLPAPLAMSMPHSWYPIAAGGPTFLADDDVRLIPRYPSPSPLEDVLRLAIPGSDEYVIEGHVLEIMSLLNQWSRGLRAAPPALDALKKFISVSIQSASLVPVHEIALRPGDPIEAFRREFSPSTQPGVQHFLDSIGDYLSSLSKVENADFEIYECKKVSDSPLVLEAKIRYDFVGMRSDHKREERIGSWLTRWLHQESEGWRAVTWIPTAENVSRANGPIFTDVTSLALGQTASYREQLVHGADYWRTTLDGAIGVDVYGNNGVAVGDFDNDGRDDLYVCQPAGLPNRLYRNRGDGTFEDVTESAGVGVLDFTACALFADFENRGLQDLLVVCASGPLLFSNQGNGKFSLRRDAFRFARPPQGAFTHAAIADYDHDGRLDIYFCLYNYYQGLGQYRYPVPYFDARNGPPNYLFHNEGNGTFEDRTEAAGLNIENDRYSFACSWGDSNGDGWPDLYVVNDFGRNNLYRNNGNGTFTAISSEAHVNEAGAGMSACWLDLDNRGIQDIYAAGMWVAAGMRVFQDPQFHPGEPESLRALYHRHMQGNSLYRNQGDGTFQNIAVQAGVEMGRWSWSTDAWDFDHDGYPDLYVANGYVSGAGDRDVSSFFWRQVVSKSPPDATPSTDYERGWGAINELIRSDSTWNGHERNVFFANNRDGTFSDVSGVVGLDFREDSRTFALSDLDGDGRIEIVLKNRNAPQVRILRLATDKTGNAVAFRLRGQKSNRDAIGAAVTVHAGPLKQTKYVQAGSGFLCQHTKELFFGVGEYQGTIEATVQWPSGQNETFRGLPVNHRVELTEGNPTFRARPFASAPQPWTNADTPAPQETLPSFVATWLVEPVKAPDFSLSDLEGNPWQLSSFRDHFLLLNFWTTNAQCVDQLQRLGVTRSDLAKKELRVVAVNLNDPSDPATVRKALGNEDPRFPILLATQEVAGIYNIVYRYMFDRHRDLSLPISFLIDEAGQIVKVYQGIVGAEQVLQDVANTPRTSEERFRKAIPFPGTLFQDVFQRNSFTYGIAFFQHGFLDQATESFKEVIANRPDDAEAYYNLGTLCLRRNDLAEAQQYLEQAVKLRPNYADAWNNLGTVAAQKGNNSEAIENFQQSLKLRPAYATALLNLGNVYRKQQNFDESEKLLKRALDAEPKNAEISYSLGMLYARTNQSEKALQSLEAAIRLRPNYPDALNNLGVLFVQQQHYADAEEKFEACINQAPDFDQAYLNLARLYLIQNQKEKARTVLQSLLQKQPDHQMARQMLQVLY